MTISTSKDRLNELIDWFEHLATQEGNKSRNAIGVRICPALITSESHYLPTFAPRIGTETKKHCAGLFSMYRVSEQTKRLSGSV